MGSALKHRNEYNLSVCIDADQQHIIFNGLLELKTVERICSEIKLPVSSFYDFAIRDPLFAKRLKEIRAMQAHIMVDSLFGITDGCETMAQVGAAKIKSDNIKWGASKIIPEIYGDRIDVNLNHHLDLSSVLLAAENRVIPILQAKQTLLPDSKAIPVEAETLIVGQSFVSNDPGEASKYNEFTETRPLDDIPAELQDLI